MEHNIVKDCQNIDFNEVRALIKSAGLTERPVELIQKAFENSYVSVFIFSAEKLVGVGRAISDGAYEAGVYDIAVLPKHQGKGIGRMIMDEIFRCLPGINIILYARPGVEDFYKMMGFTKLLTGMIRFVNADVMKSRGFVE